MAMPKKVKIVIGVLFAFLAMVALFFWYQSRNSRGLNLELTGPAQVLLGVPFKVQAEVVNDSGKIFKDVKLSLSLPEGVVFLGTESKKIVDFKNLGNLGAGSLVKEEFELLVLSGQDAIKRLEAVMSFLPSALSSRFEKDETFDLAVSGSGLVLDVSAPTKVFSGEEFSLEVSYINAADIDFQNLELTINYPPGFTFKEASLKPDLADNVWNLGDLRRGSDAKFTIKGSMIGADNAVFDFKAGIEGVFSGQTYVIADQSATLTIAPSPLSISVSLNDSQDYLVQPGDSLFYNLSYTNNTNVGLKDVVIKAKLAGFMFDFASLITSGVLRADNTVVWSAANNPELAVLSPGAFGSVSFRIKAKSSYPIRRVNDKNFTLKVDTQIESPTVPPFVAATKTLGLDSLENKVVGQIKVDAKALFRDAASGIVNNGPLPLKVGQATNFTVHWLITNFSTDVRDVEIKSFLGGNVIFTGIVKSNAGSVPVYNERTQEIVWKLDKIAATKGVLDKPLEAIFQIQIVPSVDQIGRFALLMQPTTLKAVDDFTGAELTASDIELNSQLSDDSTVGPNQGIVIQ